MLSAEARKEPEKTLSNILKIARAEGEQEFSRLKVSNKKEPK